MLVCVRALDLCVCLVISLHPPATPSLGAGWLWFSTNLAYVRVYIGYPFFSPIGLRRSLLDVDRHVRIVLQDLGSPLMLVARTISAPYLNLLFSLLPLCLIFLFALLLLSSGHGLLDFHSVRRG